MEHDFQLGIFTVSPEDPIMSVEEYLNGREKGALAWAPKLENSTIIIESEGKEWLAHNWNLGSLNLLTSQFEAAWPRLKQGQEAIIRSAVDDEREVPYLLLEPGSGPEAAISMFFMADTDLAYYYPIQRYPGHAEKLYEYVKENRSQVLSPYGDLSEDECFKLLPFPLIDLIQSLKHQADLGRQLYKILGQEFGPEIGG